MIATTDKGIEFSRILLFLRRSHKLTQNDLADKLSMQQSVVSEWENGEKLPQFESLIKLAQLFNISMDELMGIKENKEISRSYRIEQLIKRGALSIEELRKEHNVAFNDLAKVLGVSQSTLLNWKKKGLPNIDKYRKLIKYFDLSLEQFADLK